MVMWSYPTFSDRWLSLRCGWLLLNILFFKFRGCRISKCGMSSLPIAKHLDVFKQCSSCLVTAFEGITAQMHLSLERRKEFLRR